MHVGFSWNYESLWKRTDLLCTSFVSWCCSGFKDFLLSFALNGIGRANIDGKIQQRCLPKTSRRAWLMWYKLEVTKGASPKHEHLCLLGRQNAARVWTWPSCATASQWRFLLSHLVTASGSVEGIRLFLCSEPPEASLLGSNPLALASGMSF